MLDLSGVIETKKIKNTNETDYLNRVIETTKIKNAREPEFLQAVNEVLSTLKPFINQHPEFEETSLLERLVEPERVIIFRVPWIDDNGKVQVNKGYRIQFNSAIGPYKGGLRFHPSVNLSILKFLAFEQIFKNALTGLPIGGGKGGSDFDPKGKSDNEVMRFCQSFMTELQRHIGEDTDVPAGDIGVGAREIGYLFGQFKRIKNTYEAGVLTGKGTEYGGSLIRKEATGYGLIYFMREMLKVSGKELKDKTVIITGSGNVAIYACQKVQEYGANVIAMSDSNGCIYNRNGIDLSTIQQIKEVDRLRIKEYLKYHPNTEYMENQNGKTRIFEIKADIVLPCATQNEIDLEIAQRLVSNGVLAIGEGANMPTTIEATHYLLENNVLFAPAKAANAGGVATSALEMSQNSMRYYWTSEEVDKKLDAIVTNIFEACQNAAKEYGCDNNYVAGANIAGFMKISKAMMSQGIV
ncbi:MAG: NADP-specific glutamate dehydrogenase [Candidatus Gastranaerophilales bacterium]|nr:NADP-specific glutamate dehydrogenase [Candidatus Gastranaerophilales bacterium]